MNPNLLYQWSELLQRHFTNLKKWQLIGLAMFVYGIVATERCQASKISEEIAREQKMTSVERRLRRWLSNVAIDIVVCQSMWIKWVTSAFEAPRLVLLVDETKLTDRMGTMMVSLAYEGRSIPLAWQCYIANNASAYPAQGQVWLIVGLLARVLEALPSNKRVLVEMDRGLAHSSAMLRGLELLGVDYLVRVKNDACFTTRRGSKSVIRQLIKPGESHTLHGTLFTKGKQVKGTLLLVWEVGQKEAWCLFTNQPSLTAHHYALRMWQEESFRDLKSGGWNWQASFIADPRRAERLLLALAIAYAWMLTLGTFLLHADQDLQRRIFDGTHNKYSLFRSGLRFFKSFHCYALGKLFVGLLFAPPFKPLFQKLSS
jgi:hypothetical protein